jgi:hypothetical protein
MQPMFIVKKKKNMVSERESFMKIGVLCIILLLAGCHVMHDLLQLASKKHAMLLWYSQHDNLWDVQ